MQSWSRQHFHAVWNITAARRWANLSVANGCSRTEERFNKIFKRSARTWPWSQHQMAAPSSWVASSLKIISLFMRSGEAASGGGPIVAASVGDNFEKEASLQDHFVSRQRPQANRVLSTSVSRLA